MWFLAFLTLLNVMNFVDRQLLASFSSFIVPELGLSNTQFGLLTGLFFVVFYSLMGLLLGSLADRMNRTRLIAAGLGLWSLLTSVSGVAQGFWSLAVPRMLVGVGESIMTPTAMSLLADRFPPARLGFATGFYYMGVPIGAGLSLLIAGYLGPALGWRNCFYLLGMLGLTLAFAMLFVRETPRRHLQGSANSQATPGFRAIVQTLYFVLRNCPALGLTVAGGVGVHFFMGAGTFDQLWLVHERGFERAEIARISGWTGITAGVLGTIFGGVGSDWFMRRTGKGRPMFLFWVLLILAPVNVAYRLVDPDSVWLWIGLFAGFFQIGAFYGPTFSTVQELVPPQIRGTAVGFYLLMLNFIGLGVGISLGGVVIDLYEAAGIGEPYTRGLLSFTFLSFASIPLFLMAGRRFSKDQKRIAELLAVRA